MDTGSDAGTLNEYKEEILQIEGIDHIDSVSTKPVGAKIILIVKISVDKDMTVIASHQIAKAIELKMLKNRPEIDDVIVHINPDLPHQ